MTSSDPYLISGVNLRAFVADGFPILSREAVSAAVSLSTRTLVRTTAMSTARTT